jgi:hypothetical protein
VVGGYGGAGDDGEEVYHKSCESMCLRPATERAFMPLPDMQARRTGSSGGFGPRGSFYVAGGSTNGADALTLVERLDPRDPVGWSAVAPMTHARGYTNACWGMDGLLYVSGGSELVQVPVVLPPHLQHLAAHVEAQGLMATEQHTFDTVECYDPRADAWHPMPSLATARADHQMETAFLPNAVAAEALRRRENPVDDWTQRRGQRTM